MTPSPRLPALFAALALAVMLIAVAAPSVSAYQETFESYEDTSGKSRISATGGNGGQGQICRINFDEIERVRSLNYIGLDFSGNVGNREEGRYVLNYTLDGRKNDLVVYVYKSKNAFGTVTSTRFVMFFLDWDIRQLSGPQSILIEPDLGIVPCRYSSSPVAVEELIDGDAGAVVRCGLDTGLYYRITGPYYVTVVSSYQFRNRISVTDYGLSTCKISLERDIDGIKYASTLSIADKSGASLYHRYDTTDVDIFYQKSEIGSINITSPQNVVYTVPPDAFGGSGGDPDDPGEMPTLRTGSVTMTDHNGTSISGFEVTAVNYYTGEEYTVSTDTDVAVITLPMDRTVEIRNPQTGVYEEAPVGYYTFYGQKPGYKMLHEDGIRVMVMPEKYGSYKLCDILVTPESGPLTGKHQFQLRSRSDFSILQSGTISAKSRTTGIWYNTTVTNGIATLILPYDTSDAISEHAGHYYVYATSPGYEDSDYGTQIVVYPHTVSEIRTILLTPIGGVPTPGNVTLRIQVISETGQGVPNAEIFIAGKIGAGKDLWDTYTTSWTGFLEVSVPGNSTYDIVARGAGYYDSSRRIEVFTEDPPILEMYLYLSGAPTVEPTTEPTGWPTVSPTTQPTGGIPDEDDDSDGFMTQAVRSIANLFGVSFGIGKTILGMLIALAIGTATAKQLKGGAQEFGMGMLGGVVLGVLLGLLPIWVLVLLVLIVGLWIGQRYMSGGDS